MAQARDHAVGRFSAFGVDFRINLSWLLIALLIAWSMATGVLPQLYKGFSLPTYWGMAIVATLGLGLSLLLHELAHTLAGRLFGVRVRRITLFLFGGAADIPEEPPSPAAELVMASAGPAFSLAAGLALHAAGAGLATAGAPFLADAVGYLGTLNLVLAGFNMIPAFPLDGGRVLRALIWRGTHDVERATEIAAQVSRWIAFALMGAGFAGALSGQGLFALWWVLIGLFLRFASQSSALDMQARRMLRQAPLSWVTNRELDPVPAGTSLDRFVREWVYPSRRQVYGVQQGGGLIGVIEPGAVRGTRRSTWPTTTVGQLASPLSELVSIPAEATAADALERMREADVRYLLVAQNGGVSGVVTLADLMKLLEYEVKFETPRAGVRA